MLLCLRWLWDVCTHWLKVFLAFIFPISRSRFGWRKVKTDKQTFYRSQPKPEWVRKEIIRLKALMSETGCRKIADIFNRKFSEGKQMTVSKTYTNNVIRRYKYEIRVLRKKIKNKIPKPVPMNLIWGMDLTGKTDTNGNLIHLLGIIEHKSRTNLCLEAIKDKASISILRCLLDAVELYGKPKALRTDNESVFTSWIFRLSLWFMGIRHQTIDKCCPWQNGKIERFFGTLKEKLDQWKVNGFEQLGGALVQFRFWYNHIRPHQNLDGRTPAEVWNGIDVFSRIPKLEYWFEAWDGLLTGFYLKL
ncbi:MAG: integrase core domain-containing protein [Thermodesulfovibrionales bacterium]|nr:integrase core domain-containing protein [Thermodesulfovibrionales bacterium]